MTIFDIEKELLEVIDLLEQNEGDMTDEITEKLNVNRDELEVKLSQYRHIIMKVQSEIKSGNDEIIRIQNIIERKNKALESLAMYSQKAIELYGLEVSTSKAKNKPKQVKLKNDVRAVLSFTESVELEKLNNKSLIDFPEELLPYSKVDYTMKLMANDYIKFKGEIDSLFNDVINPEAFGTVALEITTNKTMVKQAMEDGVEFESARVKLKSKIEFK